MSSRRTTMFIITVLALCAVALPASALAGPLLSGYGAPGAGNQVILGATLLNGPSNGGSAGGGGSTAGGGEASSLSAQSGEAPRRGARKDRGAANSLSSGKSGARPPSSTGVVRNASAHLPTLGLSGKDVLYLILGLGAIALAGLITWRLTRSQEGAAAKGMRRNTRGIT
jgi:hypothetical protein